MDLRYNRPSHSPQSKSDQEAGLRKPLQEHALFALSPLSAWIVIGDDFVPQDVRRLNLPLCQRNLFALVVEHGICRPAHDGTLEAKMADDIENGNGSTAATAAIPPYI